MIPLLLISNNKIVINNYINKLKKDSLFFEIAPSTKEYSIEDIKNVINETKIFNPKTRFYYLPDFHLSSIPAQNSFLKLLEEPPSNVQFILSTDNKNRLLPTIISRVKIVKLQNDVGAIRKSSDITAFISPLIEGLKIPLVQFKITDKESANETLLQIIIYFRCRLESDKKTPKIIKELLRLKRLLENNNLNPQLTVDQALIFIWKQYTIKL